ncbi:MAG: prepilin-type N-terminal cleavage/methylation domain-containing protein [Magnetococcales bacterium]|nr:prepilin-type N-terminal cleavage/methylation domain-containing protein [Magnetococcales bacterium]
MKGRFSIPSTKGFTLIELIVFIVVVAVVMAGIVPLYLQVTLGSKNTREMLQAQYLAQERIEQMEAEKSKGGGFTSVTTTNFPNETNINIGASLNFDRTVAIQGATLAGGTLTCDGTNYTSGDYKCIFVQVYRTGTTAANVLGAAQTIITNY